jgi:hypothetical protein
MRPPSGPALTTAIYHQTVIKLKQVEHVRNERKTLAAVVGHPFITTLVASFSDEQCLYMLVRWVSLI